MSLKKNQKQETRIDEELIDKIYEHRILSVQPLKKTSLTHFKSSPVVLSVPTPPVLIVSDSPTVRLELLRAISSGHFQVMECSYENLLDKKTPQHLEFSLLILDTDHCGVSPSSVFDLFNRLYPNNPVILYGQHYSKTITRTNAPRYLHGGITSIHSQEEEDNETNIAVLFSLIQSGLTIYKKLRENEILLQSQGLPVFPFNMGETSDSQCSKELWDDILRIGPESDAHVYLQTEWGTRTDLVASQIHMQSSRKDSAFDIVALELINGEFLEPYLFGIEPGTDKRYPYGFIGKIEMMNHGTLLLSNIDNLNYVLHKRLLVYLQSNALYRVNSNKPIICNTRIISSGPGFIETLVQEGSFSKELFELLSARKIIIPEFRKMSDSLPKMTLLVAEWLSQKVGKPTPKFTPEALMKIQRYSWPLNTVEYEHMMWRVVVMNKTGCITPEEIVFDMALSSKKARISSLVDGLTLEEVEKEVILETLQALDYNRTATAKTLGISEKTLYNKLKEYDKSK